MLDRLLFLIVLCYTLAACAAEYKVLWIDLAADRKTDHGIVLGVTLTPPPPK